MFQCSMDTVKTYSYYRPFEALKRINIMYLRRMVWANKSGLCFDEIRTALQTGQETFPLEFIEALIDTDSRLREWRKFRGMSQAKLGGAAELSQAAVTQIETGKRKPNIDTARKLADALQCDIDDLF